MTAAPTPSPPLLTVEEFAARPDPGHPEELVRGKIVPLPIPYPRHGQICGQAGWLLGNFVAADDLSHVVNISGIITERDPDTVRGADFSFYSYGRVPKGPLPWEYLPIAPDLIVEVLSPSDRWPDAMQKVAEYLAAGVRLVVVLDDARRAAHVYSIDGANRFLGLDEELTLPEVLPGFAVPVRRFFD